MRATAVVLKAHKKQFGVPHGEPHWWDLAPSFVGVGRDKYELVLEVRPPGGEPYEVRDRFKVPRTLKGSGLQRLWRTTRVTAGLELPVDVDDGDPQKVTIDWEAFGGEGAYDAMEENRQADHRRRLRERSPKAWQVQRDIERSLIPERIEITRSGQFSHEEFEAFLRGGVEAEFFTAEEADEARRAVAEP